MLSTTIRQRLTPLSGSHRAQVTLKTRCSSSRAYINPSIELAYSGYGNGVALVMQPGTYAMVPWIPKQNRIGHGDYNSYLGGYGSIIDPITNPGGIYSGGLVFAIHGYSLRADTSSENGVAQDDEMEFEVSVDIANSLTPLSTANESVVYAFAQM